MSPIRNPNIHVMLVHGTWARKAEWTKEGSELWKKIEVEFPGAEISAFSWSGKNSARHRNSAAEDLCKELIRKISDNPNAHYFLVAHSHGGNIAVQAASDAAIARTIKGVVCMSTPFLAMRKREIHRQSTNMFWIVVGIVSLIALAVAAWGAATMILGDAPAVVTGIAAVALLWCVAYILIVPVAGYFRFYKLLEKSLFNKPGRLPENFPLFIIRSPSDEASLTLASFQFITWMSTTIWRRIDTFAESIRRLLRKPVYLSIIGLLSWLTFFFLAIRSNQGAAKPGGGEILLTSLGILMCAAISAASFYFVRAYSIPRAMTGALYLPVGLIVFLCLLPFGLEVAAASWTVDVTVEATPPGEWKVFTLAFPKNPTDRLAHSAPYDDPKALARMTQWMKERLYA
jgi:Protein of unknown function (DUF2974)